MTHQQPSSAGSAALLKSPKLPSDHRRYSLRSGKSAGSSPKQNFDHRHIPRSAIVSGLVVQKWFALRLTLRSKDYQRSMGRSHDILVTMYFMLVISTKAMGMPAFVLAVRAIHCCDRFPFGNWTIVITSSVCFYFHSRQKNSVFLSHCTSRGL